MYESEAWYGTESGDVTPEEFFSHARVWQDTLNEHVGDLDISHYTAQARQELNAEYPYFMELVHVSGRGIFHMIDEDGDIIGEGTGVSEGTLGVAKGVEILGITNDNGDQEVCIMHKIQIGTGEARPQTTVHQRSELFSFIALDSALILVSEMNEIFGQAETYEFDLAETAEAIADKSDLFVELFRDKGFRNLKKKKQREMVQDLVGQINGELKITGMNVVIEAQYSMAPVIKDNDHIIVPFDTRDFLLSGQCLGIDTIEGVTLLNSPIRRKRDLIDKDAGLCVVLSPDDETRERLRVDPQQVIFVPVSSQDIGLILD